ncbi:GNAT family N-acetyltransferase [Pedobacter arcticus]|uniref:GNAT family N-acetyltransferase n=1 Tax=Pedobacter arcticus TaxID=752140 RepID=UPI0002DB0F12|nr:GNAT family N-acetyltransferase [Pedobacter arcticus]
MLVKPLEQQHWEAVKKIYELGIATKTATFETEAPDWEEWNAKHLPHSRLICQMDERVAAWVALRPVNNEGIENGVAEISIYGHPASKGLGLGYVLMEHLIRHSEENGIWTLQAQIFEENKATIRLHEKSGFRRIGYREKLGALDGVWHNIILFERRSKYVGQ